MKQLKIQDYISVGIYTAIYFLVIVIGMSILRFTIPAFNSILIPGVTALGSGLIYLLVIKRIPRQGALTIMGCIMGLFFLISGHFPLAFVPNVLCGLGADLIQYRTKLPEKIKTNLSYFVFSFGLTGPVLPLWFMKKAYVQSLIARGKDAAYIEKVFASITQISFFVCVGAIILGSIVGLWAGRKLYAKHFAMNKGQVYDTQVTEV